MSDKPKVSVRRKPWPSEAALDKPQPVSDEALFRRSVLSPLRYPGAKRQLVPIMESIVRANVPLPRLVVEPFCGGATTTLRLLGSGLVEHGVLADVDPIVAAFWYTAAFDARWLIDAIADEPITVARWDWWRARSPAGRREKALKCIFLNRTTFSGILHGRAGPIGGRAQQSAYKIDCRFGVAGLIRRIQGVADLAATGRLLDVWEADWRSALSRTASSFKFLDADEVLFYLDPPYVDKAEWLYKWSFTAEEHRALAEALRESSSFRWLLSYDDNAAVRDLYADSECYTMLHVSQRYTAAGSDVRNTKDELLVTNYNSVPRSDLYRILEVSEPSGRIPLGEPEDTDGAKEDLR
ncbi:DNA adenine methylase [Micromonospora sp. NPDC049523]|uniref:DNA adenine methylase n=1 Tax=Micromonospora sp. NPDC049523 TaxID=3155921 RepID=UPI0034232897